ncbi:MAG: spermidine/putrescine transport system substrate-binding protein [Actinomycetota bacterium]|jgi:spermidine/putrescine transport system substrate-binding protein|nr:spermidine/putrescine transport system substrate-binding protein [Actinomycetota bacterium]
MDKKTLEGWERHPVTRRGFLTAGAAAAFLAACGKTDVGPQTSRPTGAASGSVPDELEATLSVYNWADYVNPKTYPAFEKEYGVKLTEDNYPSNEDALAKLKAGASGYDIVAPTGYMVEIMIAEGLLMELDHSKIPNLSNLDPQFASLPFDPGNRYSVPKDFGTTGFGYRSKFVSEEMASWEDFFSLASKYSGRYTVLDSPPEVVGAALKMLGYSYNSVDPKEISEATDVLVKFKPHVRKLTSSMREIMISGEAYICLTWNGEVGYVALDAPDAVYVIPAEGTEVWTDNYSIVAGAPHPAAAHAFLNYSLEPETQGRDTSYHYYGGVVEGEEEFLDPKSIAKNPSVYPPEDVKAKLEIAQATPEWTRMRNEAWTKFKAA